MTKAQYTAQKASDNILGAFKVLGVGLAGALSLSALDTAFDRITKAESDLLKMANRLNTTTETLSSFSVMIRKTGMDADSFYTVLTRMDKGLSAAALGAEKVTGKYDENGEEILKTAKAYDELGINTQELIKLPWPERLMAISTAMKENVAPQDQVRIAMEMGGRTAAGMVNIYREAPEVIQKLIDRSTELGLITSDMAKRGSEAKSAAADLSLAWEAFSRTLVDAVAPAITSVLNLLTELILKRERAAEVMAMVHSEGSWNPEEVLPPKPRGVTGSWTPQEVFKPPVRQPPPAVKGGGGGAGDMGLDRMRSIIDTLQKDLSRLTEGSLAEIREWANHTRNEIEKVGRKGAETEEAMRLVATVEGKKKEKAVEDYYLFVAKESGDNYKQIEADAKEWLTKYKGFNDAETNINAIKNRKIWEEDNRQMTERLTLRASLMSSIANEMPLLSQNLAIKEKMLPIEDAIAKLNLERAMASLKISDAQKDELRGLLALASAAKKYTLEREKWAKEGVAGGIKIFALGKKQTGETNVAEATKNMFAGVEKSIAGFIGKGIKAILFGEGKIDFAELGKEIASSFIDTAAELAVSKLFEALASTFLESILTTVPTEIATATMVVGIETAGATTSGGILMAAGAAVAGEMIAGATTAAAILTASKAASMFFFHSGGVIRAHGGWPWLASDEVPIIAQTGERILSRRQNRDYEAGMAVGGGGGTYFGGNTNIIIQPRYPMSRQETEHMVRTKLIPAMAKQQKRMGGKYR